MNDKTPLAERLTLTIPEAADLSGIPLRNLKAAIRDGILPVFTLGSSRLRVRRRDLDAFVAGL